MTLASTQVYTHIDSDGLVSIVVRSSTNEPVALYVIFSLQFLCSAHFSSVAHACYLSLRLSACASHRLLALAARPPSSTRSPSCKFPWQS